jgi:four helix bundle protein
MRDFRQLKVWEQSHKLTIRIYELTKRFPREELFALTNQIRRASSSVPANIAEGCGRGGNKEYAYFLQIATGSIFELDYHVLLARDLKYLNSENYKELDDEIQSLKRQLTVLLRKVREAS